MEERGGQIEVWCPHCDAVVQRESAWKEGRLQFTSRSPESAIVGYWVTKLISPRVDLKTLWQQSRSTAADEVLSFWNNSLGIAYAPEGARLTLELIRACLGEHSLAETRSAQWAAMGVDVGLSLHVWVMVPLPDGYRQTVYVAEVPEWQDLDRLMARYNVGCCVVDDAPELRLDVAFAQRHRGRVFLATYVQEIPGTEWTRFDLPKQRVQIERTAGLDRSHSHIEAQLDVFPRDLESVSDLTDQLCVNTKVKGVKADGTVFYHFPHTGRPDHYDHAKCYCEAALERLGRLRSPEQRQQQATQVPKAGEPRWVRHRGVL